MNAHVSRSHASKSPTGAWPVLASALAALLFTAGCPSPDLGPDAGGTGDAGADAGPTDGGSDGGHATLPSWPTSADAYTPALVAYLHTLNKPAKNGLSYDCCRDFGAISRDKIEDNRDDLDNAVASFFDALGLLTSVNLQQQIDTNLQDGSLMLLLDHWGYTLPDSSFPLVAFDGSFEGSTRYTEAKAGTGTFLLSRSSFQAGTGTPRITLDAQISSAGELLATGPTFELTLGLYNAALTMELGDMQLTATADETQNSIAYRRGKMSGYVTVQAFFDAINTYVADSCSCLGLGGALFTKASNGSWSGDCQATAATTCNAPSESFCVTMGSDDLAGSCTLTPQILPEAADLDLDPATPGYEALSLGFTWEAAPATVVGLQ